MGLLGCCWSQKKWRNQSRALNGEKMSPALCRQAGSPTGREGCMKMKETFKAGRQQMLDQSLFSENKTSSFQQFQ